MPKVAKEYIVEQIGIGMPDYIAPISYLKGRPYIRTPDTGGIVTVAGTPVIEDIINDPVLGLGRNAHTGTLINAGPGVLYVQLSDDGETYTPIYDLEVNQFIDLTGEDVAKIKLDTSISMTKYKLIAH